MAPPRGSARTSLIDTTRTTIDRMRAWVEQTLVWQIWERMLETEFIDRSVALAGKAFVSFFPLVIVVAAFVPDEVRRSIFGSLTRRLGIEGGALVTAKQAFTTADDIRRATGIFGLILMFFYASSFTTALQRVYLRAWRRPPGRALTTYVRGPAWLVGMLGYMALMGGIRAALPGTVGSTMFVIFAMAMSSVMWSGTTWLMLMGQVRFRVVIPTGVVTGVTMFAYAMSARVWMSGTVTDNQHQFGFFGVALALVTWFSGAAICIIVGACAGPVLAEDRGPIGRFIRGKHGAVLMPDAVPSLPPPTRPMRLADAFSPTEDVPTA